MINLDNLFIGALQAAVNGAAMYWGVKLATRVDKKKPIKKDGNQNGDGEKATSGDQVQSHNEHDAK